MSASRSSGHRIVALASLVLGGCAAPAGDDDAPTPDGGDPSLTVPVGAGWERLAAPTDARLLGVWAASDRDVWMVGRSGVVLHWDGARLVRHDVGTSLDLEDVHGGAPDDVWAVGDDGVAVHWDGATWTSYPAPGAQMLSGVWTGPDGVAWVVGTDRTLQRLSMRWTGTRWERVFVPPSAIERDGGPASTHLVGVHGDAAGELHAAGEHGALYRWAESPLPGWEPLDVGIDRFLYQIVDDEDGAVWVTGHFDTLLRRGPGETAWEVIRDTPGGWRANTGVAAVPGEVVVVGYSVRPPAPAAVVLSELDGDLAEHVVDVDGWLQDVASTPDGTLWAVGLGGVVLRRAAGAHR